MATISKKQIGIESRRKTTSGRFYEIEPGDPYPSITNVLNVVNKPALVGWAGKVEREACVEAATKLFIDAPIELDQLWQSWDETNPNDEGLKDSRLRLAEQVYSNVLTERIGKQKAAQKVLLAAAEIGTGTHALIEHWARQKLGYSVGPRPSVGEKSEWGFMSFEDWAKNHAFWPTHSERVVFSRKHKFAGTLDLVGLVDGVQTIVDIKTGKAVYSEAKLQIAAYWGALVEMESDPPVAGLVLRLPKIDTDPEFEAVPVDDLNMHLNAFLHALELWRWQYAMEQEYKAKVEAA